MVSRLGYHSVPKSRLENLRFRDVMWKQGYESLAHQQYLKDVCKNDILFYFNTFLWTYDPRRDFVHQPFITYGYQSEGILDLCQAIDNGEDRLCEKSRDMGMSVTILAVFDWYWRFHDSKSFLVLSRKEDLVDKAGNPDTLFSKLDYTEQHLPQWLKCTDRVRNKLHLKNPTTRSVIDGESTTGDAGRGGRRTAVFPDEFAFVPEGMQVLKATADVTNCRIFGSTPNGTGNAHYMVSQGDTKKLIWHWSKHPRKAVGLYRVQDGGQIEVIDKDWHSSHPGYEFVPEITQDRGVDWYGLRSPWYDDQCKRRNNVKVEIAQELDISPGAAGDQVFDSQTIALLKNSCRKPLLTGYATDYTDLQGVSDRAMRPLKLWFNPDAQGLPPQHTVYTMGVDVSQGSGASDSCISIADRATGEKVASYTSNLLTPDDLAKVAVALAKWFTTPKGYCYMTWEGNGPGSAFGKKIIEQHKYPHVYYQRPENTKGAKKSKRPGWFSNKQIKHDAFLEYRSALYDHKFINLEVEALNQCEEYIFNTQGGVEHVKEKNPDVASANKENHGDMVIADLLAFKGFERQSKPKVPPKPQPYQCLMQRIQDAEREKNLALEEAW